MAAGGPLCRHGTALVLGGCNFYPSYGASRGATTQGQETFKLYSGMMTTGIIVGGIVFLLILWTVLRYRRRSEEMPRQFHENVPIEILYTVVPVIIVAFLFWFTVITENNVDAIQPVNASVTATGKPVVNIRVTAFQWGWRFDYPDLNVGVAGETTNGPNNHGPQMVVPVGETVQITLVSDDVIHGFYVRDFNFSRYALPGVTNFFDLNVVHTGTYNGQCTQICGLYHSEMLFSVRAVTRRLCAVGPFGGLGRQYPAAVGLGGHQQPSDRYPHHQRQRLLHALLGKGRSMTTTIEPPELITPEQPGGPDGHPPGSHTLSTPTTRARPASSTG